MLASAPPTRTAPCRAGLPHSLTRCPLTSWACPLLSFRSLAGDATVTQQLPRAGLLQVRLSDSMPFGKGDWTPTGEPGPRHTGKGCGVTQGPGCCSGTCSSCFGAPGPLGAPLLPPTWGLPHTALRSGALCAHARGPLTSGPPPATPLLLPSSSLRQAALSGARPRPGAAIRSHLHRGVGTETLTWPPETALSSGARPQSKTYSRSGPLRGFPDWLPLHLVTPAGPATATQWLDLGTFGHSPPF